MFPTLSHLAIWVPDFCPPSLFTSLGFHTCELRLPDFGSRARKVPMGFISRKVFPACGNMCVCCPALRPSSRQPVKRYKKLLGDIFPKSIVSNAAKPFILYCLRKIPSFCNLTSLGYFSLQNEAPNERKIIKLCEYAARNPLRMPKVIIYFSWFEMIAIHFIVFLHCQIFPILYFCSAYFFADC